MISIIVPAYNESKTLPKVLDGLIKLNLSEKKEIILINDGSTDDTTSIGQKYARRYKFIKYHSMFFNYGKGAAIRKGLREASGEIIFIRDADMEYEFDDIKPLTKLVSKGMTDVAYGSRFLQSNPTIYWSYALGNKFLSWITSALYGVPVSDMETCYKCFRKELIIPQDLCEDRFGIEPELTAKLLKKTKSFREIPITYRPRTKAEGKKIRAKDGIRVLWVLLRERFS